MPRLLCVFSDRTVACWEPKDVTDLLNSRNAVPPPLEQLQQVHGTIPAVIALLEPLRQQLPPIGELTFADLALKERLDTLRERIPHYRCKIIPTTLFAIWLLASASMPIA